MPVASVDFYDVIRWVHISAVAIAFGPTFAYGIFFTTAQRADPRSLPVVLQAISRIDRSLITIGAVVVFATGIYLTIDRFSFGDVFVNVGLLSVIVLLGLTHGFFLPGYRRASEILRRDIEDAAGDEVKLSTEFDRFSRRVAQVGMLAALIVVVTIYFMTAKPFL
jgi:uncharacterized membrane protein